MCTHFIDLNACVIISGVKKYRGGGVFGALALFLAVVFGAHMFSTFLVSGSLICGHLSKIFMRFELSNFAKYVFVKNAVCLNVFVQIAT